MTLKLDSGFNGSRDQEAHGAGRRQFELTGWASPSITVFNPLRNFDESTFGGDEPRHWQSLATHS